MKGQTTFFTSLISFWVGEDVYNFVPCVMVNFYSKPQRNQILLNSPLKADLAKDPGQTRPTEVK